MISYIVGNPGSGKTYYAVYKIYEHFIKVPKKGEIKVDYLYCYTNINEFKFEKNSRLLKFDFDKFYIDISELYALYSEKVTDDVLNEKAKELKLHKVLIVLDESHNFLKASKDPALVWWLTYHRHLYQEIYLITQDLSLINPEYKRVAEQFIKAVDASKRLFAKKFKYFLHGSYKMFKKDLMGNVSLPYAQEVFNLYHSGNSSSNKSFVRRFLFIAAVLFIFVLIFFKFVILPMFEPEKKETSEPVVTPSQPPHQPQAAYKPQQPQTKQEAQKPTYIYNLSCIDDVCSFAGDSFKFPYAYVAHIIRQTKPFYFYQETKNPHLTEYFLVFQSPALEDLKNTSTKFKNKGVSDENQELNIPNPFGGK